MKRVLFAAMLLALSFASSAQGSSVDTKMYYLDVSAGYALSLPPFSNANTSTTFLKPRSGGSMSFCFVRNVGDTWGVQVEVLTTIFDVKKKDLVEAYPNAALSQISLDPYRSTFFGTGVVTHYPFGRFTLDVKGSVGGNLVEYARQDFVYQPSPNIGAQSISVSSKRSIAPALLLGSRLRYPIGASVDVGIKVEYGISYAKFDNLERLTKATNPEDQKIEKLPSLKRTVSYLNTGLTLGLRF